MRAHMQTIALPQGKQRACQPAAVRINPDDARDVEMEIGEGAHHQVRRFMVCAGIVCVCGLRRCSLDTYCAALPCPSALILIR